MTPSQVDRLITAAIAKTGVQPAAISHRTHFGNLNGADGTVYFNGESVRIRRVIGMDWSTEGPKIRELQFIAGDPDGVSGSNWVLISDVTARRLGARVGDQIIVQVYREGGAINTIPAPGEGHFSGSEHLRLLHGLHGPRRS